MTTSTVSSSSSAYRTAALDDPMKQSLKSFKQLAESLKSSDLDGAKKAFRGLQQSLRNAGQVREEQQNGGNTQGTALQQLGSALDAGDLEGAQKLFENLMRGGSQGVSGSQSRSATGAAGYAPTEGVPVTGSKLDVIV